jgi:hypothetical protein
MRTYLFFFLLIPLGVSLAAQDCFYQLRLEDSGGDGFTGGVVTVTVAGVPTTYTLDATNDDGSRRDFFFPVTNGAPIQVGYLAGAFPGEVTLSVRNNNDSLLFTRSAPASAPALTTLTAECVDCAPPPLASIDLFRVRFNSVDVRFRGLPAGSDPTYLIEYGPDDFDPTTDVGTTLTTQDTLLRIGELAAQSTYSFYLSTLCSPGGDTSERRGPFRIRTQRESDVGVTVLESPTDGCAPGATRPLTIGITNFGGAPQSFFRVDFTLNGESGGVNFPFDGIFTGVVGVDSTELFTYDTEVDLSEPGYYEFEIFTQLEEDEFTTNDTLTTTVVSLPVISDFPYVQDFEGGDGFWLSDQLGPGPNSWARGRPRGNRIDRAASGSFAYVTNPRGQYNDRERSVLNSPCFDFSALEDDPVLSFSLFVDTEEEFDRLYLESSTDGGESWQIIERNPTGINWYNNGLAQAWDGSGGFGGGYALVSQQLDGLAGEADVNLRFVFESDGDTRREGVAVDNIRITEQARVDLAAVSIDYPVTGGCFGLDSIDFTYTDVGTQRVDSATVIFNGTEYRVAAPTVRGQQLRVGLPVDIAGPGPGVPPAREFEVVIRAEGDGTAVNDTVALVLEPVREVPFLVDFEDGLLPGGYRTDENAIVARRDGNASTTLYKNLTADDGNLSLRTPFYSPIRTTDTLSFQAGIGAVAGGGSVAARLTVLFEEGCADRVDTLFTTDLGALRTYTIPLNTISDETGIFTFIVERLEGSLFIDLDDISVRGACPAALDVRVSTAPTSGIFADDGEAFAQVFTGTGPYSFSWSNGDTGASADSLSVADYAVTVTDALGCSSTVTFDVGLEPTSLTDPEGLLTELDVFPNPTAGPVTLRSELPRPEEVRVELYDARGRRSAGATLGRQRAWAYDLDLSDLPDGLYFLRVRAGDALRTVRLSKN